MEHTLTFVVKGNGSHLAILQLEFRHSFEGGQCQLSLYVGVVGIVASPYFFYDASTLRLPLITDSDSSAVVAQFGRFEERTRHDTLKLCVAVEVDVCALHTFIIYAYGNSIMRRKIAEHINGAVGTQVLQFDVEVGLVVMAFRESCIIYIRRCSDAVGGINGRFIARNTTHTAIRRVSKRQSAA